MEYVEAFSLKETPQRLAKIRTLKAEFFRDEDISSGGLTVKTLAAGLICCIADDEGRFKVSLSRLRGEIFTHDSAVSEQDIETALNHLRKVRWLATYTVTRQRIGAILHFSKHQRVPATRFVKSEFPAPPNTTTRKQGASKAQADRKHGASGIGIGTGIGTEPGFETNVATDLKSRFHELAVVRMEVAQ